MKKILAVAVASLICSMAAFEALAFEPETVEVAGEKAELSETAAAFAADSIDGFAYEDETYGTLLYYNNFESGSADSPTYRNMDYLADYTVLVQPANAPGSVTLTADPADAANTVLRAQRSSGALFGVQFSMRDADNQYVNFATKHGKYTIVADIYVPDSDPSVNLVGTIWYPSWSHSGGSYRFGTASAGAWSKNNACASHTVSGDENAIMIWQICDWRGAEEYADGSYFLLDNVRVYCAETVDVTYDLNLPEGVTKVYDAMNSESLESIRYGGGAAFDKTEDAVKVGDAVPELYLPDYSFMGWVDQDGNAIDTFAQTTTKLTAKWKPVAPGLNILTGTAAKADFESGSRRYMLWDDNYSGTIAKVPAIGNDSSRALQLTDMAHAYESGGYYTAYTYLPVYIHDDRPYTLVWDAYTNLQTTDMRINLYHIYGEWQHQWVGLASQSEWNNMEAWATNQTDIMAKLDGVRNKYLVMEYRYNTEAADPAFDVFFDNLAVYPQYKITYVLADGTEVYDYALFDADGKTFLTEYTPKASLLGSKRYKLAADAKESFSVDQTIALANADITLYAVTDSYTVEAENVFSYRAPSEGVSAGIRFKANVSQMVRADADEYGFIVARTAKLGEEELKFGADTAATVYAGDGKTFVGKTDGGVTYTGAVNYKPGAINITYGPDKDTNNEQFCCMLVGLDKPYTEAGVNHENRYDVQFSVRPYVIISGNIYYGDCLNKSYAEIAMA